MVDKYLEKISGRIIKDDYREESFYPALSELIKQSAKEQGTQADVTSQPRKTEAGNPDMRVWDGRSVISRPSNRAPTSC